MKKLYLLAAILVLSFSSFAQRSHKLEDTRAPERKALETVDQLVEKIQLMSDNQKDSLFTVMKFYFEDLFTYRKSKRENLIDGIVKLRDEQVSKILRPSQYKEYYQFMEEARIAEQRRNAKKQKYGNKSM